METNLKIHERSRSWSYHIFKHAGLTSKKQNLEPLQKPNSYGNKSCLFQELFETDKYTLWANRITDLLN